MVQCGVLVAFGMDAKPNCRVSWSLGSQPSVVPPPVGKPVELEQLGIGDNFLGHARGLADELGEGLGRVPTCMHTWRRGRRTVYRYARLRLRFQMHASF